MYITCYAILIKKMNDYSDVVVYYSNHNCNYILLLCYFWVLMVTMYYCVLYDLQR